MLSGVTFICVSLAGTPLAWHILCQIALKVSTRDHKQKPCNMLQSSCTGALQTSLSHSTFSFNNASYGGGVTCFGCSLNASDVGFHFNNAVNNGGGLVGASQAQLQVSSQHVCCHGVIICLGCYVVTR